MAEPRPVDPQLQSLRELNARFMRLYEEHPLFQLVARGAFREAGARAFLVGCVQLWSSKFQRIMLARAARCESPPFRRLAEQHLAEEFGHDKLVGGAEAIWDPILEAVSEWFLSRVYVLDDPSQVVLIHLVLEGAALVAYPRMEAAMRATSDASLPHWTAHTAEAVDVGHMEIGFDVLGDLPPAKYEELRSVIDHGWQMWLAYNDRIVELLATRPAK